MKVVKPTEPPQTHPDIGLTRLACSKVRKNKHRQLNYDCPRMGSNELKYSVWCIEVSKRLKQPD